MSTTVQRPQGPQIVTTPRRRRKKRRKSTREIQIQRQRQANSEPGSLFVASIKASLIGGVGMLLLMLISLIPFPFLACLVIPGFLVVLLATGMMAGIFAGDNVRSSHEGGRVGWMAGFWTGIYGGLIAMVMAAAGFFMVNFGENVVSQVTPDWWILLNSYGLTQDTIALAGRVVGALIVFGVAGSLLSGLFSSIGGMLYPKLSD